MLTRRSSSALLREAGDEQSAHEVLLAYTYSKIHRGNTRKALFVKLERIQGAVPQKDFGTPFYGAFRRVSHALNSARTSWGGKSVVGSLAELHVPSTPIGRAAWVKAVGGPKKFDKLLRQQQDEDADTDDEDDDHRPSLASAAWQPQPQPQSYVAPRPSHSRTHSRNHSSTYAQ